MDHRRALKEEGTWSWASPNVSFSNQSTLLSTLYMGGSSIARDTNDPILPQTPGNKNLQGSGLKREGSWASVSIFPLNLYTFHTRLLVISNIGDPLQPWGPLWILSHPGGQGPLQWLMRALTLLSSSFGLAQCWEFTGFLLLSWKHCVASEESLCLPVLFISHTVKLKGIVPAF